MVEYKNEGIQYILNIRLVQFYFPCLLINGLFCLDLEELLHQLGVGHHETAHQHSRKRRSITKNVPKGKDHQFEESVCNQETSGDWAKVRDFRAAHLPLRYSISTTYHLFLCAFSGLFFCQSVGGYFCSGSSFADFQGQLQTNLSCHHSTVARQCL